MEVKQYLDKVESYLQRYRLLIGVCVFIMLVVLCIQLFIFFDKQDQIIETGGYVDGKIKCVCNQEVYDDFMMKDDLIINFSSPESGEYGG